MNKKEFYKRFPSKEMKVLTIGEGARSIIARNCIDKQKLRGAIGKVSHNYHDGLEELIKELGLEW